MTTAGTSQAPEAGQEDTQPRAGRSVQQPPAWRDGRLSTAERVTDLLARMTVAEKAGQLSSVWLDSHPETGEVAPHQNDLADLPVDWPDLARAGLGQLTRPFGTRPLRPLEAARELAALQSEIMSAGRFAIPALAHDECLAGFATWTAAIYPVPLAWGASFDPGLVRRMAAQIGDLMRSAGVHQGLAPVLDVCVDPRWGRTEETISEDPYLVATVGTAYVQGLESTGLVATLKHFAGYSASRGGRNLAPAAIGPRQVADRLLPPFEMAVRLGGARSVMHSYADIDGIPTASDPYLLSEVLRDAWGFTGTVVADYFGISFLELLHGVAEGPAEAAALALRAGVDVELPVVRCYGQPLVDAVRAGLIDEALVDRAARRVLEQKCDLGLLDEGWDPRPPALAEAEAGHRDSLELDPPAARAVARELAEESVVLLSNDGILPLAPGRRLAVVGPRANDPMAMLGCYAFPSHVGARYADLELGVAIPTVLEALRAELPGSQVSYAPGCGVDDPDTSGIEVAAELAADADVCIAVLGDRSGLFGRGTSGEGCDAADLSLPGQQGRLLRALLSTGTPVVLVLLAGRPYALGEFTGAAAMVQAFFPGEEGGPALARILSGAVSPSGRLPVSIPRHVGAQPASYLAPALSQRSAVSSLDPTPLYTFGHGLSYTTFSWTDPQLNGGPWPQDESSGSPATAVVPTDATIKVAVIVRNVGDRPGTEVVQLYLHDPVAQVTRPVVQLIGYARVCLEPAEQRRVTFAVHADQVSFTGRDGQRIVEPGRIELRLGRSSAQTAMTLPVELAGPQRTLRGARKMIAMVEIS